MIIVGPFQLNGLVLFCSILFYSIQGERDVSISHHCDASGKRTSMSVDV